jgi:hypothetical protein
MRFAGNFHPEWGYLAPAPSFLRTARVALVAAAVGATAGAGVVLSLTDRPVETSVAARTLVRPVEAGAADVDRASQAAPVQAAAPPVVQPQAAKPIPAGAGAPIASESTSVTTAVAPANIAALAEAPFAAPVTDAAAAHKKAKTRHNAAREGARDGPLAILPSEYSLSGTSRWADRDAGWGAYSPESPRYR